MTRCKFILIFAWTLYTLLIGCASVVAQVEQPARFEKKRKFNDNEFSIISLKEEGLALIRETNEFKSGNQYWEVIVLDTLLQEKGSTEIDIHSRNSLIGFEYTPGNAHLLFKKNDTKGGMDLVSINLKSNEVQRFEVNPELNIQLTHFSKIEGNFIFGGFVGAEPTVLLYVPLTNNLKVLPGFFQKNTELIDLRVNQNATFNALLVDRSNIENHKVLFKTFDSSGKELLDFSVSIDNDISLQTGISSMLEREDLIVLGTWGKQNSKQSNGFFGISINPFKEGKIIYTPLGQLNHYLDYLRPKRAQLVKSKTQNSVKIGKVPDFTDYIMPIKIVEHPDGFLLVAEVYEPTSSSNQNFQPPPTYNATYPYYNPMGYYPYSRVFRPTSFGSNVITNNEVRNIETVLLAFNAEGNVVWDHSIKLAQKRMPSIDQVSDFSFNSGTLRFLYKQESELRIKTITLDEEEISESSEKIALLSQGDQLKWENESLGSVKHWFGNKFYVWGHQSIYNAANSEDKTRQIFYVNKVVVH